jgi:hypothetical protein
MRELVEELIRVGAERDKALEEVRIAYESMQSMRFIRGQLEDIIKDAEAACDEWEKKNGDAPHSRVRLPDRIRVNAGLPDNG